MIRGGREEAIIDKIRETLEKSGHKDSIVDLRFIAQRAKNKNLVPGYIFCYANLNFELVKLIYSIDRVVGFPNYKKNNEKLPEPLSPKASADLLKLFRGKKAIETTKNSSKFQIGDLVKVTQGTLANCSGNVIDIDEKKNLLTININFLGKSTPAHVLAEDCVKQND